MSKSHAVLVGINRYSGFIRHDGKILPLAHYRLYGCINDVEVMQSLLVKQYRFAAKDIQVLTDEHATTEAILECLRKMIRSGASGDRLLFFFSGHGSMYAPATVGHGQSHPFEILCPHDVDWDSERFISEPGLKAMIDGLPNRAALEVVLDTCCAGGMRDVGRLHDAALTDGATAVPVRRSRFLSPPEHVLARFAASADRGPIDIFTSSVGALGQKRCVLWAASNEHQTSEEFIPSHGREHGAFTYFFTKQLVRSPTAARAEVLNGVHASLKHERFSQTPQLFPNASLIHDNGFLEPGAF
jgi:hypothetical protein